MSDRPPVRVARHSKTRSAVQPLVVLAVSTAAFLWIMLASPASAWAQAQCGPPYYECGNRTLDVIQLNGNQPVPLLPAANSKVTLNDFGNTIVRVTGPTTDPQFPGASWVASRSGGDNENLFSSDEKFVSVGRNGGGIYIIPFDGSTMSVGPALWNRTHFPKIVWSHAPADPVKGTAFYEFNGRLIKHFTGDSGASAGATVYDFSANTQRNSPLYPLTVNWSSLLRISAPAGIPGADGVLGFGLSSSTTPHGCQTNRKGGCGQGTGFLAVGYKLATGDVYVFNTYTQQVFQNGVLVGTAKNPVGPLDKFTLHAVDMALSDSWMEIDPTCNVPGYPDRSHGGTCKGPYYWQVGTTTVIQGGLGGHRAPGYANEVIGNGNLRFFKVPFNDVNFWTHGNMNPDTSPYSLAPNAYLPSGAGFNISQHISWQYNALQDTLPIAASTACDARACWAATTPHLFVVAMQNEIVLFNVHKADGTLDRPVREAHTFIVPSKTSVWGAQYAIGAMSPLGNFFAFTSNWGGMLDSTGNRSDVFITRLR
jgi:hypothetical protein